MIVSQAIVIIIIIIVIIIVIIIIITIIIYFIIVITVIVINIMIIPFFKHVNYKAALNYMLIKAKFLFKQKKTSQAVMKHFSGSF